MNRYLGVIRWLLIALAAQLSLHTAYAAIDQKGSARGESVNGEVVQNLDWEVLMPADYSPEVLDRAQLDALHGYGVLDESKRQGMLDALSSAPVVEEMDGKMVRIPGFVVPLVEEGFMVMEFFLVPYFGACIHVPPPPSNQMVHVKFDPGTELKNLETPVWVVGKLVVETTAHDDLGTAGYKMEALRIEPYDE